MTYNKPNKGAANYFTLILPQSLKKEREKNWCFVMKNEHHIFTLLWQHNFLYFTCLLSLG